MQPQVPVPAGRQAAAAPSAARIAASLKRCAFLLDSSRLVITDPVARAIAAEATAEARSALAAHDAGAAS